jgi:hypothetical protein
MKDKMQAKSAKEPRWSLEKPERSLAGRTRKGAIESGTQFNNDPPNVEQNF